MRSRYEVVEAKILSWKRVLFCLQLIGLLFLPIAASAQIEITLKKSFINDFKDRATIDSTYTVDKAHKVPNPPSKDGDMHVAGRAPEIGLATVAEIMNAKFETNAVDAVHEAESSGSAIKVSGAWRIWCEHPGSDEQTQEFDTALEPFVTTNPPHVFEIHPITSIEGKSILDSLRPIVGFTYKDADTAFERYEGMECEIQPAGDSVKIITKGLGFNYAEFWIDSLDKAPHTMADGGLSIFANVLNRSGEVVAQKRRMVFVKGSKPAQAVLGLKPDGKPLHVVGIPRIDLALVSYRVEHADTKPEMLKWNLPYEMIIVAVVPDTPSGRR